MAKPRKKKATALSRQSMDPAWVAIDEHIGGRRGLLEAAEASDTPKAAFLVELLLDKAYSTCGTKKLAQKAGLSAPEIVDLYRNKKWLEATMVLHHRLPEVVEGAVTDAMPSLAVCEECKGAKQESPCWQCGGSGEVRKPGDKDKLGFIGEAVGLVGKKGPFAQVNVQVNSGTIQSNSFEDLLRRATVKIGQKQVEGVIEGEVVKKDVN